ncbi:MAG: tripartite tricarboxylate transporter substrate binding protein [Hyphomicrobiales bacterium]|nr:tripartite tricarboxylate transporter substrate binding protein [Hyphomicrobiales bacterium]
MRRRSFLTMAAFAGAALVTAVPAVAQTFPSEPITLIVAWPAGGGSDISMRLLADALSKRIKVPVVVLNKPGAGGAIGHREIVNAKPDGYTIGMYSSGGIALPYLNAQANTYDEMQPIAFFGEDPNALEVSNQSGIGSLKEYVERARANPGKIKNGNDQPGGSSHIAIALYEKLLNMKVTRVSYGGFGPTVTGLMAGEVDSATVPVPDTIEQHKAGKLKILGVSATERHFLAPDIPTFREQGFDVVVGSWRCVIGPKGIPADRLQLLESNIIAALKDPEFQAKAKQAGFVVQPGDAKSTLQRWKNDDTQLYPVLLEAGLVKARQK